MQAIRRIILKEDFKHYNIPDGFGEQAEVIILPLHSASPEIDNSSRTVLKIQEKSGMMQMLNEPEEDVWNEM